MSRFEPCAEVMSDRLRVRFREGTQVREAPFDCVVDLAGDGRVIGVEILDFARQSGGGTVVSTRVTDAFRWAYDPEVDAFYLHVQEGPAPEQKKSTGRAWLDAGDRLLSLEVAL